VTASAVRTASACVPQARLHPRFDRGLLRDNLAISAGWRASRASDAAHADWTTPRLRQILPLRDACYYSLLRRARLGAADVATRSATASPTAHGLVSVGDWRTCGGLYHRSCSLVSVASCHAHSAFSLLRPVSCRLDRLYVHRVQGQRSRRHSSWPARSCKPSRLCRFYLRSPRADAADPRPTLRSRHHHAAADRPLVSRVGVIGGASPGSS